MNSTHNSPEERPPGALDSGITQEQARKYHLAVSHLIYTTTRLQTKMLNDGLTKQATHLKQAKKALYTLQNNLALNADIL